MPPDHSGDLRLDPASRPPAPRRRSLRAGLMLGAGAALAMGLVVGLWARPQLGGAREADDARQARGPVPIEIGKPAAQPEIADGGKLEVLPPETATASAHVQDRNGWGSLFAELGPPPPLPPAQQDQRPRVAELKPPAWPTPRPPIQAAYDCTAGGLADQMVCADEDLAEADREMSRAYRRALRAGISPSALRADQRDWLGIREEAAHHSRRALAEVYQQRIEELTAAAGEADAPGDGY